MSTELRRLVKKKYDGTIPVLQILHPKTKVADPTTQHLSTSALDTIYKTNDVSSVGGSASFAKQIKYDLANAKKVYAAFSIDPADEDAVANLTTAIQGYTLEATVKDKAEIKQELFNAAIESLKGVTKDNIEVSYKRTSTAADAVTLDALSTHLGVALVAEDTDLQVAEKIENEIN